MVLIPAGPLCFLIKKEGERNMETANNYQQWAEKQRVQVKELPGIWVIDYFTIYNPDFVEAHVTKLKRDGTRSKYNSAVGIGKIMTLEEEQPKVDTTGLTARDYAQEKFSNGYAVSDFCRTTCESLTKVLSISAAGRIKVQPLRILKGDRAKVQFVSPEGHKTYSQEERILNWNDLVMEPYGEPMTFTPRLFDGKWGYWNDSKYLKVAGMKLTQLLD